MRGNIRNEDYAILSRIYAFSTLQAVMPNNITPSDIDSRYFVERRGHFLWFEFKTDGTEVPTGQRRAYEALLYRGRPTDALIIARHDPLTKVNVHSDLVAFTVTRWDQVPKALATTKDIAGDRLPGCISEWFAHAEERPNSFITTFRQHAGIYPGNEEAFA